MSDDNCCGDDEQWVSDHQSGDDPTIEGDGGITTLDEVLHCLSSSRRRTVLYHLQDVEIADVDELAKRVAANERDSSTGEVPAPHRKKVETQLVHNHLPKMAEAQLVEYDRRSSTVRYREPPGLLSTVLELLARLEGRSVE